MVDQLPLTTLASQAFVAFTIEFDNEFEHRMPHRTTASGPSARGRGRVHGRGPWLVSRAMWSTCLRFVGPEGVRVGDLQRLARTRTNLDGLRRWGYITLTDDHGNPITGARPPRDTWLIRATDEGKRAQEIWAPLTATIEQRWRDRFGAQEIDRVVSALSALTSGAASRNLPDCMPILGHGLWTRDRVLSEEDGGGKGTGNRTGAGTRRTEVGPRAETGTDSPEPIADDASLPALLARFLLPITLAYEREASVSLAIAANILRVLDEEDGLQVRAIPQVSGLSKEAVAMALKYLGDRDRDLVSVNADKDGGRWKVARLTDRGAHAKQGYPKLLTAIARASSAHDDDEGEGTVGTLRQSLEQIVGDGTKGAPIWECVEPYPDGWRASAHMPDTLPHFPVVLHRGGYPDGS